MRARAWFAEYYLVLILLWVVAAAITFALADALYYAYFGHVAVFLALIGLTNTLWAVRILLFLFIGLVLTVPVALMAGQRQRVQ